MQLITVSRKETLGVEKLSDTLYIRYERRHDSGREQIAILDGPPAIGVSVTVPREKLRPLASFLFELATQLEQEAT